MNIRVTRPDGTIYYVYLYRSTLEDDLEEDLDAGLALIIEVAS